VIRAKYYDESRLHGAPSGFPSAPLDARGLPDTRYTLQVYAEDCTGCALCVEACPVQAPADPARKAINLVPLEPVVAATRENIAFFEGLPVNDRSRVDFGTVRGTQFLQPLFEFPSACAGCGETPYLKLLTQLFGDRLMVDNATGCSSIYGGNLPTTSWTANNAEFLGFRLAADLHAKLAHMRLADLREPLGPVDAIVDAPQRRESQLAMQRQRIAELKRQLDRLNGQDLDTAARYALADLRRVVDHLVRRSVWLVTATAGPTTSARPDSTMSSRADGM
jgi:pyruvate-ferredoxin/flavodoxin oxidoreductase